MHVSCALVSQQSENVAFQITENVVQASRRAGGCWCGCHEGI